MRPALALALLALANPAPGAERIASLSPAATRMVTDLGAARELVAVTRWCELPADHPARRDADAFEPDLESLAALRPTLVIVPRLANPLLAERLRGLGLRTEVLAPESPDAPARDIARLGALLGRETDATRLLEARRAQEALPRGGRRLLILWDGVMAGSESYLGWVIVNAGCETLPGDRRWPEWDSEVVARYNPELVLYLHAGGPEKPRRDEARLGEWKSTPGLRSTLAASTGCVYELRAGPDWLPASGLPRAAATLRELVRASGVR